MYAKTGRWKFAEEQYIDIVSKYLPTKCCKLAELIPISVLVMGWPCWLEITQHPCVCHHLRLWCPVENEANYLPTNYEGKYRNFIVEKSRVHHFNQMIQVNVAHKGHTNIICLLIRCTKDTELPLHSSKNYLNLIMRTHQTGPHWGSFYKGMDHNLQKRQD